MLRGLRFLGRSSHPSNVGGSAVKKAKRAQDKVITMSHDFCASNGPKLVLKTREPSGSTVNVSVVMLLCRFFSALPFYLYRLFLFCCSCLRCCCCLFVCSFVCFVLFLFVCLFFGWSFDFFFFSSLLVSHSTSPFNFYCFRVDKFFVVILAKVFRPTEKFSAFTLWTLWNNPLFFLFFFFFTDGENFL